MRPQVHGRAHGRDDDGTAGADEGCRDAARRGAARGGLRPGQVRGGVPRVREPGGFHPRRGENLSENLSRRSIRSAYL